MMRLRALVADDDPEMLNLVAHALDNFGADVVLASSGGELLETIAEQGPFDVVVTDISMPWMTGLQVMHSARTAGLASPVVVMTALRDSKIPEQVASLGTRAALVYKPFSVDDLFAALQKCLGAAVPVPKH